MNAGNSKRNCTIDMMRYLCAIMVVAIHTNPFEDINSNVGYIITQIIPRIGVPFFLAVSGYFYIQKLEKGGKPFFKYIKHITAIYLVWSCPYYVIDFIQWGHSNLKGYIVNCVYSFVYTGSYYHFWFFPALIYSVILTTIIWKLKCQKLLLPISMILYVIGCLGCSYYRFGIQIPVLNRLYLSAQFTNIRRILMMGFPFFVSGFVVYKINLKLKHIKNIHLIAAWLVAAALWITEIIMVAKLNWQDNIVITIGLYLLLAATLLLLVRNPMPNLENIASKCRTAANVTYYTHPMFILLIACFCDKLCGRSLSQTPTFILTVLLTGICSVIICKINYRGLNWLVS